MSIFRVGATTHVGQVRQNNQDAILVLEAEGLFAVADGMGGHRGGEVASQVAITALQRSFVEPTIDSLVEAVQAANDAVVSEADGNSELKGMGTTLCVLCRITTPDDYLAIANVGDSRLYLLRSAGNPTESGEPGDPTEPGDAGDPDPAAPPAPAAGDGGTGGDARPTLPMPVLPPTLEQITEDHSLVATLVRQGQITKDEAEVHPNRNILTRALGIDARVLIDSWVLVPVKGDVYLICSDGLFNEVGEVDITEVLRTSPDPQTAADTLVDMANAGGGRDNISVVIVEITDDSGRGSGLDTSGTRIVREMQGSERAANDRDIMDAVAGSAMAGAATAANEAATAAAQAAAPPGVGATVDGSPGSHDGAPSNGSFADAASYTSPGGTPAPVDLHADTELGTGVGQPMAPDPSGYVAPAHGMPGGPVHTPPSAQVLAAGPSRITWRVGAFVIAMLLLVGAIGGAFLFAANNTYYVGIDNEQVTIFRGRPGGVLWMQPTVEERTDLVAADVPPQFRDDLVRGRDQATLEAAQEYVTNIRTTIEAMSAAASATTTTTRLATTTTTTSTQAPTTTQAGVSDSSDTTVAGPADIFGAVVPVPVPQD